MCVPTCIACSCFYRGYKNLKRQPTGLSKEVTGHHMSPQRPHGSDFGDTHRTLSPLPTGAG